MKAGNDFIYVTQKDNILFMWLDEPINTENGWKGKHPYVNSVLYKKIKEIIGACISVFGIALFFL